MSETDFALACLTVRLGAIRDNYRHCARLAAPAAAGAVVKADAYGLGAAAIAPELAAEGCDSFFVARLEEGLALRPLVPDCRVFVLDGVTPGAAPALIAHRLTPVLNTLEQVAAWQAAAGTGQLEAALHIDTGMNRLGLSPEEVSLLAGEAQTRLARLRCVLILSHLACGDEPDHPMNRIQLARFREALAMLPPAPASLAASAGLLLGRDYLFDLVRPGLGLYGGNPNPLAPNPFAVAAQFCGRIVQLRRIDKGESVGYAASFRSARPTVLATVALGYADGIMRAISNRGQGALRGAIAPVAGRVSMDLVTLDLGPQSDAATGDWVEFFGDHISLESHAAQARTSSYEVLTGITPRVPRRYLEGALP